MNQTTNHSEFLRCYDVFAYSINEVLSKASTIEEFRFYLKSGEVKSLREAARKELNVIYQLISHAFDLPNVQFYVPLKPKERKWGITKLKNGMPVEVRIYAITARGKPYARWSSPTDLQCLSKEEAVQTLIHEAAHVLDIKRNGSSGHGPQFYVAQRDITDFVSTSEYGILIPKNQEHKIAKTGCMVTLFSIFILITLLLLLFTSRYMWTIWPPNQSQLTCCQVTIGGL